MPTSSPVLLSLVALSGASLFLSAIVLRRFANERRRCHLYWGAGLALVFVTVLQEALVYAGYFSQLLLQSYFVLVAVLVGVLSLGSAELSLKGRWRLAWSGYIGVTGVLTAVLGFLEPVGPSAALLTQGVITGNPPTMVVLASSLLTFPGTVMLAGSSLWGAFRERRWTLLYIAAGIIIIAIAGAIYALLAMPVALYYAEFVGVLLLFLGFVKVPALPAPARRASLS